jgi:hypothetical protein
VEAINVALIEKTSHGRFQTLLDLAQKSKPQSFCLPKPALDSIISSAKEIISSGIWAIL